MEMKSQNTKHKEDVAWGLTMAEYFCVYVDVKTASGLQYLLGLAQEEWHGAKALQKHPQY